MFPFIWGMADWSAPRGCIVTDQNEEACLQTPESITVHSSKQNNPELKWRQGMPQLSDCHLAVCWSWASYYTSSERGHPRLSADKGIWAFDQLIGISLPYFGVYLGSTDEAQHFDMSPCNPLGYIKLPYIRWKGRCTAIIWGMIACS